MVESIDNQRLTSENSAGVEFVDQIVLPIRGAVGRGDVLTKEQCGDSWNSVWDYDVVVGLSEQDLAEAVERIASSAVEVLESVVAESSPEPEGSGEDSEDDVAVVESTSMSSDPEIDEASVVGVLKGLLSERKYRTGDLVKETGYPESVLDRVLTEQNGFRMNQHKWWILLPGGPTLAEPETEEREREGVEE